MNRIFKLYFLLLILFGCFTFLFIDQNFIYLKSLYSGFNTSNRLASVVLFTTLLTSLFFCYLLILKNSNTFKDINLRIAVCVFVFLIFAYPAALSFDIFNYIATAKVTYFYQENPYIVMPVEFVNDPILLFTHAANKIALYGPFWITISSIPFFFSFGNYLISIVLFKAVAGLAYFGIVFLTWKLSKNINHVLIFAASPLVLIETFISGHNDVVMMFFALFAIYLFKKEKIVISLVFLALSLLIKYATIFLIPVFIYMIILRIQKKQISWDKVYLYSFLSMSIIFFLSFIREEIYPWYAIWPMVFVPFLKINLLKNIALFFTFGLMLRYIPFMYSGSHFGLTPYLKSALMFLPPVVFYGHYLVKKLFKQ